MNEENKIKTPHTFYTYFGKRALDLLLSILAIIALSPLLITVCVLELAIHGSPIFYRTKRPGKDGKIIEILKFRSMTNEKGEDGKLLPEEMRLTKFGRFLRRTSIDELPELYNIIKGDMSIIGPRPLLVEYLELYNERHAQRHAVKPGLACVRIMPSNSNTWTWREQFENDIYYIEHLSFKTDIKMLFLIVKEVIVGSDYRTDDIRVPFSGDESLDETGTKSDLGIVSHFSSIGS